LGVALKDRSGFAGAVQFLTRVPVRRATAAETADVVIWFPVVGALIGAVAGGTVAGLTHLVPGPVAAAVGVLVGVLVTGAFHEDGLADTADAIAGGPTRERRFEILKDPRHGTYGVAALCGSLVLRVVTVATLGPAAAFAGLVAAHTLGRGAAVVTMAAVPVARPDGLGADYARSVGTGRAVAAGVLAVGIVALATGWWAGPLALAAAIAAVGVAILARRSFGGITGDILGAIEQVAEALVLIVVSGLAQRHAVWWA
jgi:adenosylcobinamide-GDP ribazoletransferase